MLFVVLRDIVAGRNWRNLTITVVLAMLTGLNVSYHMEESPVAWLPIGYVLTGVAETWGVFEPSAAPHALTAGATGLLMILAMARRASLGDGGRVIRENGVTVACVCMCYCSGDPARLRAALA